MKNIGRSKFAIQLLPGLFVAGARGTLYSPGGTDSPDAHAGGHGGGRAQQGAELGWGTQSASQS